MEHLLNLGAAVGARDDGGLIPLHNACSFGHAEVVSLLLKHGADPNARDNWNYTPLHEAASKSKFDVCIGGTFGSYCLKKKKEIKHTHFICESKDSSVVEMEYLGGVGSFIVHMPNFT